MKQIFPILSAVLSFFLATQRCDAQNITGHWSGAIVIAGTELGILVDFTMKADSLSATIDIPQQGAKGLALTAVRWESPRIHFELPAGPGLAVFDGALRGDSVTGSFRQAGFAGIFYLTPAAVKPEVPAAEEVVPYRQEEVVFHDGDVRLAGTLTTPAGTGPFPALVMITGSGPQNRDEELFGFKPFRIIADYLTRRGIAVLRYDDRGVGGSSGNLEKSTTADFADDVAAAVELLKQRKEVESRLIGLCGHSEGGIVAPLVASRSKDVAFIILLAGPAIPGHAIITYQIEQLARAGGATDEEVQRALQMEDHIFAAVRTGEGWDAVRQELRGEAAKSLQRLTPDERAAIQDTAAFINARIEPQIAGAESPWFKYFIDYDPAPALRSVRCPVLAIFGELDKQVPPALNEKPMREALASAGNPQDTVVVMPKANHLFLSASTGSPTEYATLTKEFVPGFLDLINSWLASVARRLDR